MDNNNYRSEWLSGLLTGALAALAGILLGTFFSGCGGSPIELHQLPTPEASPVIIYLQPSPTPCDCEHECKRKHH